MTLFQRYIVNGLAATAVHYTMLVFNMEVLAMPSAGVANAIATLFGIATSFLGNRIFVFQETEAQIGAQAMRFVALYSVIALIHGFVVFLWSDIAGYAYSTGFVLATVIQFILSYIGNKFVVFRK